MQKMSAVGFEPTRTNTLRPERNPLDHSGKLTNIQVMQCHRSHTLFCIHTKYAQPYLNQPFMILQALMKS